MYVYSERQRSAAIKGNFYGINKGRIYDYLFFKMQSRYPKKIHSSIFLSVLNILVSFFSDSRLSDILQVTKIRYFLLFHKRSYT